MSKRLIYRIIWMPSALACVVLLMLFIVHPLADAAPGAMKEYTTSDKSLQVLHPENWEATETGAHGVSSGVKFVGGPLTLIRFSTDLAGSLVADIARANNSQMDSLAGMSGQPGMNSQSGMSDQSGMGGQSGTSDSSESGTGSAPVVAQKSPLQKLHDMKGKELQEDPQMPDYQDGDTQSRQIAGAEALITDFTYTEHSPLGNQPMVGKRATALLGYRRLLIFAHCPKQSEKQVIPLFDQMIDSLKASQAGG